jgi:hypothetical protein
MPHTDNERTAERDAPEPKGAPAWVLVAIVGLAG